MNPALVVVLFEEPIGGVGQVGPSVSVALVGNFRAGHELGQVARFHGLAVPGLFGQVIALPVRSVLDVAAPVVDGEEGEGVIQLPGLAQVIDDLSYDPVHYGHLSGVHLHPALLPGLVLFLPPRGDVCVPGGELDFGADDPERLHPLEPLPAQFIPTCGEFPLVFLNFAGRCMKGPMGSGEGKVEKKGFFLGCLLEEGDSLLADRIGEVVVRVLHEFLVD